MAMKDLALLLLRISGLILAVNHGWGKVSGLLSGEGSRFISGVQGMGFPLPGVFAWAAALSETLGGILVGIGLFTRIGASFAAFTMCVAAFLRHNVHRQLLSAVGISPLTEDAVKQLGNPESAVLYMLIFLAIVILGPGKISIEGAFRKGKG
jgi:putative oxidoreductase